jgi:hypothetical protein
MTAWYLGFRLDITSMAFRFACHTNAMEGCGGVG